MGRLHDWFRRLMAQGEARDRGFILIVVISALGILALVVYLMLLDPRRSEARA